MENSALPVIIDGLAGWGQFRLFRLISSNVREIDSLAELYRTPEELSGLPVKFPAARRYLHGS